MGRTLMQALAVAAMQMRQRRHEFMVLEHILLAITFDRSGRAMLAECGADIARLRSQLDEYLDTRLPKGGASLAEINQSPAVTRCIEHALFNAQKAGRDSAEVGDIVDAMFDETDCWAVHFLQQQNVTREKLRDWISSHKSSQDDHRGGIIIQDMSGMVAGPRSRRGEDEENDEDESGAQKSALAHFTVDLIEKARLGRIDPLIGRDGEIARTLEVLARRRKNNPVLVGEPGTGKTAVAEGVALAIHEGRVPEAFKNCAVYALDMGSILAGTRYRGDFESRVKAVVKELKEKPGSILVIDEIHTLVGAGAAGSGAMDASNLLKPMLADGELRCIGSTTHEEFRNHFEKDRALARRFQRIDIREPSASDTLDILKGLQKRYETFHKVRYAKGSLEAAVELSSRHMRDRLLPDKAIDIMDEAGASVKLKPDYDPDDRRKCLVTTSDIERTVSIMAGIPRETVSKTEQERLAGLDAGLKSVLFGQDAAVDTVVRAVLRSRAGLGGEDRPMGAFLFYGPTGVGKTEMAKSLASILNVPFLRFDMSEYMEKHAVARLIGTPPGYVGFEQGGLLTEAVRKNPNAVLLLDEIEKAHPDIYNILLQVMDYATLTDNTGNKADFRHVTLIMTTNAGAQEMEKTPMGFFDDKQGDAAARSIGAIESTFSPEFRNRLDAMVPFNALGEDLMPLIVDKSVKQLKAGLEKRDIEMRLSEKARLWLAKRGFDRRLGARPLQRVIRTELEDKLAREVLFGSLQRGGIVTVNVAEDEKSLVFEAERKTKSPAKAARKQRQSVTTVPRRRRSASPQ